MNQVHKVIWSRVKNCYIVVSEITKRVGRDNKASVTGIRPLRALLCAMVIAGCMLPADVDAAPGLIHAGTGATTSGDSSIAYGYSAKAMKKHSIAQGTEADAEEEYALAMGYKATAKGLQSLAIGRQANAIGNNSIAAGAEAKGYAKDGIAIGNNAESGTANNKDPRIPSIESNNGVAVGNSAKARGGSSVSVGNDSIGNGPSSVAIGNAATANDVRTTAIGNNAHAEGAGSLSIGREASALTLENATSTNPLVTGTDEQLDKKGVMAIGDDAKASGNNSIALGTSAKAGDLKQTRNSDSVTLTGSAKRITKLTSTRAVNNAVAIGTESSVQSDEDIAVGYKAATVASKYHQLPGSGQVAIGSNSNTYGSRGDVAIGSGAETNIRVKNVDHTNGPTEKRDAQSVAIGSVAKAYGSQAVAVGADTRAIGNSSVAIGTDDIEIDRTRLQSLLPGLANNENLNNKAPSDATLGSAALHDKPYYVKTASIGTASVALGAMSQAAGDASMAMGLNALAEGDASTAIGPLARSKGKKSIAMGVNANSQVDGGVALGADSVSNRQQTSNAYIPSGADTAQVNAIKATKGTTGAVSVGSDTVKRQIINVAAGTNDSDAVNVAQLKAVTSNASWTAQENGNDVNAVKNGSKVNFADGTNTTTSVTKDASGKVTAVKYNLKKDVNLGTDGSLTINGNTYINKDGINAGNKQITHVASGGNVTTNAANIGDINRIVTAKDKYVTGGTATYQTNGDGTATLTGTNGLTANVTGLKNNYVTSGSVSNDGKTLTLERNDTGKVNVDLSKIFTEVAKEDYHLVANPEAGSQGKYKADSSGNMVLTVANEKGEKKQVTLTDIASKAQQNTNTTNITNINNTIAKGLNFGGDSGADINKKLGEKLEIKGGASADLTDGNIGVVSDGTKLNVKLKKDVDLGPNGSLTINGKTYVNKDGLNANSQKITNVADGTANSDAVNLGQLNAAIGGTAKATTVKAKDANVTVTEGTNPAGGKEYTVGLGDKVTLGTADKKIVVDGTSGKITAGSKVTIDGTTGDIQAGTVKVTGAGTVNELTNRTWDIDNPTVVHGQAATEDQLKTVSDGVKTNKTNITNINNTIGKGLNFGGDSGAVINKKLGEKLEIKGGASADLTDDNIGVVSDGTKLNVKLKKDVNLGPDGSLTINGKTYVNKDGLNANNQKITNVATGTAGTDAVNVDQLNAAIAGTAKATTVKAKDANVTVTEGTNAAGGKEFTVGLGNVVTVGQTHPVTVNGDAGTVNGLTNTTWDIDNPTVVHGQAATEDQLKTVSDGVKTNKTNITKNANDITNINTTIGKGLNFKGDDATVINKKLGEQLDIKGGADASKLSDGNIGVVSGNGALNIKLAKDVKVDSVTTGNTVINNNGLTVGGKTYVTNNGLNANNQKVTNVADGQVAAGSKDAVNGGQLHDAKNEVINKGLRFDADNNSEKTNKLGSKVTVNGDNNITTEITQTGDDTKIGVKLNEDIHVKTVTAADTVKAGGVTMGSQTSGGTTGNYVTGLDNKTWNVTNPTAVSGRAATEDQLKTVTEAINNQSAAATDYRLVQNASSADGSYTVDTNGNIDLTVEDKNHAGQKETVKLKDIASKSKLDDVIAKGLQFDANAGGTKTNKLGSKITVKGEGTAADTEYSGENLKTFITQDPAGNTTINVKMNKNLKVETIVATGENGKDGKIGINGKDGVTTNISVTRDGKPGVDGAPGATTTRIVYEKPDGTKEEVATLNDGMKYGGDTGNVIKKKLNEQVNVVGGITDENKLTTEDNLGVVSDGNNNLKVRLAKALKGLESITAGDTFINNNGITISNGAAGNTVSLTKNGLDNGGNKITNVAAGDVSANSTDAVNGSQLHDVKTLAGQHTTVKAKDSNITVTEGTNGTGGKEYTVGLGDKVTLGTDPSKQVSIDGTTGIIKAGDKVTIDGTTGNIDAGKVKINGKDGTVNGLTNKTWDPNNITSGQAATEDQLKAVDQKITNTSEELTKKGMDFAGNDGEFHRNLGDKVTIKGEGTKAASEYSGENIKTFADANGNLTVKMDKNLKTETIVATGKNGKDGKIGINGKDGVTTNISVTRDGKPGVDGAPGATTTRIVYEKPDGTKEEVATLNDGMKYGGDTGNVIKKKLNEQVNVVGGITDTNKLTTEDNLGVVSDGNNNLKVRMAKDLKGLNSVTTNTLTVGDVKIDNSGINAGNKKITNVAAGDISANSTDAVNGGQLWKTNQTINNIGGAVNELGDRMDRVGAGAAALAALHPLDFDPDDKWDVAAGYGNYKDAHAVSVGAFYRPNEDTMFSVGGSFGGGENMVNAGVSVKLGQGNHVSTSKVAMAKEIVDLRDENKDLKKRLDTMEQKMNSILGILDMGKKKDFPDVPENHWAYEYVATLAGNGILEGYPDGMFSGDRTMTRYEFAAMFYRALKNGAPVDDNMDRAMNEFEPELRQIRLDRIRVDRISGKDNDRNKVERVRVNSEDDKANNDYRDVYGSHISPEA